MIPDIEEKNNSFGTYMSLGLIMGLVISLFTNDWVWFSIGLAIGVAIDASLWYEWRDKEDQTPPAGKQQ